MAVPTVVQSVDDWGSGDPFTFDTAIATPTSGNLLILIGGIDGTSGVVSIDSGAWTAIYDNQASSHVAVAYYKSASGSESTFSIDKDNGEGNTWTFLEFANWDGVTAPAVGTIVDAGVTDDWEAASATALSGDALYMAWLAHDNGSRTIGTYPSEFPDNRNDNSNHGGGNAGIAIATSTVNNSNALVSNAISGGTCDHSTGVISIQGTGAGGRTMGSLAYNGGLAGPGGVAGKGGGLAG